MHADLSPPPFGFPRDHPCRGVNGAVPDGHHRACRFESRSTWMESPQRGEDAGRLSVSGVQVTPPE